MSELWAFFASHMSSYIMHWCLYWDREHADVHVYIHMTLYWSKSGHSIALVLPKIEFQTWACSLLVAGVGWRSHSIVFNGPKLELIELHYDPHRGEECNLINWCQFTLTSYSSYISDHSLLVLFSASCMINHLYDKYVSGFKTCSGHRWVNVSAAYACVSNISAGHLSQIPVSPSPIWASCAILRYAVCKLTIGKLMKINM